MLRCRGTRSPSHQCLHNTGPNSINRGRRLISQLTHKGSLTSSRAVVRPGQSLQFLSQHQNTLGATSNNRESQQRPGATNSMRPVQLKVPRMSALLSLLCVLSIPALIASNPAQATALPAAAATTKVQPSLSALFLAAVVPVLKVFMLCSIGALCAKKGLLAPEGRRVISSLVLTVFTPALFFSKLGSGVGLKEAMHLWPLHAHMVTTHIVGLLLGLALVKLVRPPKDLRNHLLVATAIGNVGNLPLVLIASLGSDPGLPFLLGTADAGLQFVILSNVTAAFIQFPLANALLKKPKPEPAPEIVFSSQQEQQERQQQQQHAGLAGSPHPQAVLEDSLKEGDLEMQTFGSIQENPMQRQQMQQQADTSAVEVKAVKDPYPKMGESRAATGVQQQPQHPKQQPKQQLRQQLKQNSEELPTIKGFEGRVPYPGSGPMWSRQNGRAGGVEGSSSSGGSSSSTKDESSPANGPVQGLNANGIRDVQEPNGPGSSVQGLQGTSSTPWTSTGSEPTPTNRGPHGPGFLPPSPQPPRTPSLGGGYWSRRSAEGPRAPAPVPVSPVSDSPAGPPPRATPRMVTPPPPMAGYWSRQVEKPLPQPPPMGTPAAGGGAAYPSARPPHARSPMQPPYPPSSTPSMAQPPLQPASPSPPSTSPMQQVPPCAQPQPQPSIPPSPPSPTNPSPPPPISSASTSARPSSPAFTPNPHPISHPQAAPSYMPATQQSSSAPVAPPTGPQPPSAAPPPFHSLPRNLPPGMSTPQQSPTHGPLPKQAPTPQPPTDLKAPSFSQSSHNHNSLQLTSSHPPPSRNSHHHHEDEDEEAAGLASQPLLSSNSQSRRGQPAESIQSGWLRELGERLRAVNAWLHQSALWRMCSSVAAGVLTPPTIACFAGMLVASIKPLQSAVFLRGQPLYLLGDIAFMLGDCTVPALMLVLGANLANGPGVTTMPWRCLVGATMSRLLVLPLVGTALVVGARHFGIGAALPPMAIMVMLVSASTPTAIMMHAIATVYDNRADDMAALLFWEYLLAALTLPLLIAAYLVLVGAG